MIVDGQNGLLANFLIRRISPRRHWPFCAIPRPTARSGAPAEAMVTERYSL